MSGGTAETSLCGKLGITPEELARRLAFLDFTDEDRRNLESLRAVIRRHVDDIIAAFYEHLNRFEELRVILSQPGVMERLRIKQRDYLLTLGEEAAGLPYAEGRLRIGLVHEQVGLQQKWYLGAYSALLRTLAHHLAIELAGEPERVAPAILTAEKLLRFDEIFVVDTYYQSTTQRLVNSLRQLDVAHQELSELAWLDPLTHVANRRSLMEKLERELRRARRYRHPLTVLFLDVDHFKDVNDRYGHAVGDRVLQRIVRIAGSLLRPPDIVGRYGGEEFAIGLVECDVKGARPIADRIRSAIERSPLTWEGRPVAVTVSIGIAGATPDTTRIDALIERADRALYRAKAAGRNRVEVSAD